MKKVLKFVSILLAIVVLGIAGLLCYVKFVLPDVGRAPDLKVQSTPQRIARGSYLANSVCMCIDCHSTRDWSKYAGPRIPGTEGEGGFAFDEKIGLPGKFVARNITPYNIGSWTDGEVFRAITSGVDKDGKALFPIMPYLNIGRLDTEDVYSLIAYIRTLPPVKKDNESSAADFPMNFIINTIPQKPEFHSMPSQSDTVAYGKYMITAAGCADCHTKTDKGKEIPGMAFAGGMEFHLPNGTVRSANITPDMETGIGRWSKEAFIQHFKAYADSSYHAAPLKPGEVNTVMPWEDLATMKAEDLAAIYTYLRTLPAVSNKVIHFSPEDNGQSVAGR